MKKNSDFTVTCPKLIVQLCSILIGVFTAIAVLNTIFSDPHPLLYVSTVVMIYIPCTWAALWAGLFKITVKGSNITVRRHNGLTYRIDVSEITSVDRKITQPGVFEITTVRTASRQFKFEAAMMGSEKMLAYILDNVDSSRIHTIQKKGRS